MNNMITMTEGALHQMLDDANTMGKIEAVQEIREAHEKARERINSQCKNLINMSTIDKYAQSIK